MSNFEKIINLDIYQIYKIYLMLRCHLNISSKKLMYPSALKEGKKYLFLLMTVLTRREMN